MSDRDLIRRFLFEHSPMRGHIVHLDSSWIAMCDNHDYPEPVRRVLGEAAAAAVLIASTRKFAGSLSLQLQGSGPMHLLVVQCSDGFAVRGVARWSGAVQDGELAQMAGEGKLVVTVETADSAARYQGVVPLVPGGMAQCLEAYFRDSEQLPTRIWLASAPTRASGLLLQRLPESARRSLDPAGEPEDADEAWNRIELLASTLKPQELLELEHRKLLRRLFSEEDLRLFESAPVYFQCRCSRERVAGLIRGLGRAEAMSIVEERGEIEVRCEFCNRLYRFDSIDSEHLFRAGADSVPSGTIQ